MNALLALLAAACTKIPDPEQTLVDAGAGGGGEGGGAFFEVPYAGRCTPVGNAIARDTPMLFMPAPEPGASVSFYTVVVQMEESNTFWRLDGYVPGWPSELRGVERKLGVGVNADFATCVHCLLVFTDCDATGGNCQRGPYFAHSGTAAAPQIADAAGELFTLDASFVELMPVTLDAALHITPLPDTEECFYWMRILVSGRTETAPIPASCEQAYHCDLAPTAANRHP